MAYKLVIFDMDGTILNTLEDLADSMNYALRTAGYPVRTIEEIKSFVGNGLRKLTQRALPKGTDEAAQEAVLNMQKKYYKEHCADKTRPYDGILELLKELRESGLQTAVVSNKADFAVQELCRVYFDGLFDCAIGEKEGVRRKPSPDSVNEVLRILQTDKKDAVYIGDSDVDIQTAQNAGLDYICVSWGFREREFLKENGARVIVDSTKELKQLIL